MTTHNTPEHDPVLPPTAINFTDRLFDLGRTYITSLAFEILGWSGVGDLIFRHWVGDWGDLCDEDQDANWHALEHGLRILSRYNTPVGDFYVITESDRSYSTVMLVSEY
jgi:hypothetical protein